MTSAARLERARAVLVGAATVRVLLVAAVCAVAVLAAAAAIDLVSPLSVDVRRAMKVLAMAVAGIAALLVARRLRRVTSRAAVALWLEEREPALSYALVTIVESPQHRALDQVVAGVNWSSMLRGRVIRAIVRPALTLLVLAVVLAAMPHGSRLRVSAPRAGDALEHPRRGSASHARLRPIVVSVTTPAYVGRAITRIDDPSSVSALAGSVIVVEGPGSGALTARLTSGAPVTIDGTRGRWRARFVAAGRATLLHLEGNGEQRLLAIDVRPDAPPMVTLESPARDTVLRRASGRLSLAASARDDIGLVTTHFETIVSSGEGESFTFRSSRLGARSGGGRSVRLDAVLDLDALALRPGDIVHLRAVARDANDVSGPGIGTSETRTIRVARAGENDSVSIEPAPPGIEEKSVLSQRMLIMLAEALERRRPRLPRATMVDESRRIARDQARLRKLVGEIVFTRLSAGGEGEGEHSHGDGTTHDEEAELLERARKATEHTTEALDFAGGESPVVATNRPLLEAYQAMWDAGRELDQASPRTALPHMRRALAAIQRARQAERIYLRGRPPAVVVDLARVRLAGKEKGDPEVRRPIQSIDSLASMRAARLGRALLLARHAPDAAVDSLLVLRVESVGSAPVLADALDTLADAIRRRQDATVAIQRARRAASGEPIGRGTLGAWSGAEP